MKSCFFSNLGKQVQLHKPLCFDPMLKHKARRWKEKIIEKLPLFLTSYFEDLKGTSIQAGQKSGVINTGPLTVSNTGALVANDTGSLAVSNANPPTLNNTGSAAVNNTNPPTVNNTGSPGITPGVQNTFQPGSIQNTGPGTVFGSVQTQTINVYQAGLSGP